MYAKAEAAQPITGRGIGYKLFTQGLIPSMAKKEMQRVYRLLKEARERGDIPWEWIVHETRSIERTSTWADPEAYARCVARSYRRDFWNQQPVRCEVWSEKGTIRGVLEPVLNRYAVGFRVMHGFSGATTVYDVSQDDDGRELVVLYVGDFDPSGMFMSEVDLPNRFSKYDGDHVTLRRIALTREHVNGLPSFPASDKKKDPRYKWFVANYGDRCWELDAMDPNDLRDCVEQAIVELIEPVPWKRCEVVNRAEQESLKTVLGAWGKPARGPLGDSLDDFMSGGKHGGLIEMENTRRFDDHFGICPTCRKNDGYINVGKGHWFYCAKHKVKWFVGTNLFRSWKHQTEDEQRAIYEALNFGTYTKID
jgi:hypothetical protein